RPIAVFYDDSEYPIFMPVVSDEFANGLPVDPTISGNFDVQTATALSIQIKSGALPVPVEVLEQDTIGPALGENVLQKSFFAGAIGVALLLIFMIVMYGKLGLIADLSLITHSFMVLAILKLIPVVITVQGIAGFLLSIGIALDSNILIF